MLRVWPDYHPSRINTGKTIGMSCDSSRVYILDESGLLDGFPRKHDEMAWMTCLLAIFIHILIMRKLPFFGQARL